MEFKQNKLQQLYPRLNINRFGSSIRSNSVERQEVIQELPIQPPTQKVSEKPKVEHKPLPKAKPRPPSPPPPPPRPSLPELNQPESEEEEEPISEVEESEPKTSTPEPLPTTQEARDIPLRESTVPKKGEKGTQRKYSMEQRKSMYLNKLSRKSVKKAEEEVERVNKVLEDNDNSIENINEEERQLKSRLRLVNCAKLFLVDN